MQAYEAVEHLNVLVVLGAVGVAETKVPLPVS